MAWTYSSGEASETNKTDMKTNPLIVNGVLYGLNPQLRLFALDAATGNEKWVYDPVHVPLKGKNVGRGDFASSTKISRGVAFYKGSETDQRIIYAPGGGHALYCVDALTGKLIKSFGDNGIVDLHDNLDVENAHEYHISLTSPGIIYKDLIIVGSRLSEGAQTPPGHIRAFDVHTGKLRWIFHTIPHPGEPGYETYENKNAYKYVGGANAWGGFSLDEKEESCMRERDRRRPTSGVAIGGEITFTQILSLRSMQQPESYFGTFRPYIMTFGTGITRRILSWRS